MRRLESLSLFHRKLGGSCDNHGEKFTCGPHPAAYPSDLDQRAARAQVLATFLARISGIHRECSNPNVILANRVFN